MMSKKGSFMATYSKQKNIDGRQNAKFSQRSCGQLFCCGSIHLSLSERQTESLRRPCFKFVGVNSHHCSFDWGVSGLGINVSILRWCICDTFMIYLC